MNATKITFRSRNESVNVYGNSREHAESMLRAYLADSYGARESSERADADIYTALPYEGTKRGVFGIEHFDVDGIDAYGDEFALPAYTSGLFTSEPA